MNVWASCNVHVQCGAHTSQRTCDTLIALWRYIRRRATPTSSAARNVNMSNGDMPGVLSLGSLRRTQVGDPAAVANYLVTRLRCLQFTVLIHGNRVKACVCVGVFWKVRCSSAGVVAFEVSRAVLVCCCEC